LYISDNVQNRSSLGSDTAGEGVVDLHGSRAHDRTRSDHRHRLTIATSQDGGGGTAFSLNVALPLTCRRTASCGSARSSIRCVPSDHRHRVGDVRRPERADVRHPLSTSATPLGPHGLLQISPSNLDFGAIRVGQTTGTSDVDQHRTGGLSIVDLHVVDGSPAAQFAIPFSLPRGSLRVRATVYVSCTPTTRGPLMRHCRADISMRRTRCNPFTSTSTCRCRRRHSLQWCSSRCATRGRCSHGSGSSGASTSAPPRRARTPCARSGSGT